MILEAGALDRIRTLALSLATSVDQGAALDAVLDGLAQMRADLRSSIRIVDRDARGYRLVAARGASGSEPHLLRPGAGLTDAVAAGGSLLVHEVAEHPRGAEEFGPGELPRAWYGAPLQIGGQVLGVLGVGFPAGDLPTQAERAFIDLLATCAGTAVHHHLILPREKLYRAQVDSVANVSTRLGGVDSPERVFASISQEAARLLSVDSAELRLREGEELVVAGLAGAAREVDPPARVRVGQGLTGRAVAEGRTILLDVEANDRSDGELARQIGNRTVLCLPLTLGPQTIGVLTLSRARPFRMDERNVAEVFARQAAVAVQHARLYGDVAHQAARIRTVAEMGLAISATLDPAELAQRVLEGARTLLGAPSAVLFRLDAAAQTLVVTATLGADESVPGVGAELSLDVGAIGLAVRSLTPVVTSDMLTAQPRAFPPGSPTSVESNQLRAVAAIPLTGTSGPIGALSVSDATGRRFTSNDVQLLRAFGEQVALALENSQLQEAIESRAAGLRSLARIGRSLSSVLDLNAVLAEIAHAAAELIGLSFVSFWIADEARETLTLRAFSEEMSDFPVRGAKFGEGGAGWVARHRRPLDVPDVFAPGSEVEGLDWWREHGLTSFHAVPVVCQDRLIAVLALCGRAPFRFGRDQMELLDGFVAEAAVAIRNAQLYEAEAAARAAAETAARVKRDFLATMSHEIRAPVNAVIGMTGLLLDTEMAPEQREYAEAVRQGGELLLELVHEILDFSRLEAGGIDLEVAAFDLRRLVEETVDLFGAQAAAKGLTLVSLVEPAAPVMVRTDPGRLRQILFNLVGNAVKFTKSGAVAVRVSAVPGNDLALRFAVSDTGTGITPAIRSKLFRPLTHGDGSTSRPYGGSGLGLAICHRLVGLLGGDIGFETAAGGGSTFRFTVRCPSPAAGSDAAASPRGLEGRRVMVIDPTALSRHALREFLQLAGARVDGVPNCRSASEVLRAAPTDRPYDAVVADLDFPGMPDAVRMLTAAARRRPLVVLGLSARSNAAVEPDVRAVVPKPVRGQRLLEVLASLLDGCEVRPVRPPPSGPVAAVAKAGRVLVADDSPMNQKIIVAMLGKLGHRADVVADGREAVSAVARVPYDLILMDSRMSRRDGFEATPAIRELEDGGRHVAIVALTANAMQGDRERCLAAGMDDHLAKPVTREALSAALGRWLPSAEAPAPPVAVEAEDSGLDAEILAELRELADGEGPTFLADLLASFEKEGQQRVRALREALADGDRRALLDLAHALKGSSANLGASRLSTLCGGLEADLLKAMATAPGDPDPRWAACVEEIASEFARASGRLEVLLGVRG